MKGAPPYSPRLSTPFLLSALQVCVLWPAPLWAEGTRETTEGHLDAETGARPTEQNLQVRDGGRELTFT